jgi:PAS domain S-box-containing protein
VIGPETSEHASPWSTVDLSQHLTAEKGGDRNAAGPHRSALRLDTPEHQLQVIYRTSFDAFLVFDDERRLVRANEPAAALLGAPLESVLTRRLEHFTPEEHWPALQRFWVDLERQGSRHGSHELLREDGSRTTIEFQATWDFGPGQHLMAAHETGPRRNPAARARRGQPEKGTLTPREREVLQLAADGRSPPEIARILAVSPGTVKTHFQHIYKKLGAHDRASAVAQCLRERLIK